MSRRKSSAAESRSLLRIATHLAFPSCHSRSCDPWPIGPRRRDHWQSGMSLHHPSWEHQTKSIGPNSFKLHDESALMTSGGSPPNFSQVLQIRFRHRGALSNKSNVCKGCQAVGPGWPSPKPIDTKCASLCITLPSSKRLIVVKLAFVLYTCARFVDSDTSINSKSPKLDRKKCCSGLQSAFLWTCLSLRHSSTRSVSTK